MTRTIILLLAALLVISTLSGCVDSARKESAHNQWERKLNQARLMAAQKSMDEGNLAYAQRLLEPCTGADAAISEQATVMMAKIDTARQQFAKARQLQELAEETY